MGNYGNALIRKMFLKIDWQKNIDFYVDAFNKGSHQEPSKPAYSSFLTVYTAPPIIPGRYDENIVFSGDLEFHKLGILEKTAKCYVVKDGTTKSAISLDFKTLVIDCDKENPRYYTSVPGDRFVVRRNADDLF